MLARLGAVLIVSRPLGKAGSMVLYDKMCVLFALKQLG
jgi:hypothetical protein